MPAIGPERPTCPILHRAAPRRRAALGRLGILICAVLVAGCPPQVPQALIDRAKAGLGPWDTFYSEARQAAVDANEAAEQAKRNAWCSAPPIAELLAGTKTPPGVDRASKGSARPAGRDTGRAADRLKPPPDYVPPESKDVEPKKP